MIDQEKLRSFAADAKLFLNDEQLSQFDLYANMLVEWNEKINLTAITEPDEILLKHFLDSILLLNHVGIPQNGMIIDVGTGAGFPAIPLKIVRPDLRVTLLDSLNKRIIFLQALSEALGQKNLCVHARAEEGGRNPQLREQFDLATARAVAHLRTLAEYCLPFVKVGGIFAAMKGGEIEEELSESKKAIHLLGGKIVGIEKYRLLDGSSRSVVAVKKISQTSTQYPRLPAKMRKNPLI